MEKLVQWMTLQELRDVLEQTRLPWETTNVDDVLAEGQRPAMNKDTKRHQSVADDLLRRPSTS